VRVQATEQSGPHYQRSNARRHSDFDQGSVWAILVGGTNLPVGNTVEGLTTSYYRRPAGAGDTLMQMGRWFRIPTGYGDLVRLFIGNAEDGGVQQSTFTTLFGAFARRGSPTHRTTEVREGKLKPMQCPSRPPASPVDAPDLPQQDVQCGDCGAGLFCEWTEKGSAPTSTSDKQATKMRLSVF